MIAHKRHQLILDLLREQSPVAVPELERRLRASPATVRRDLQWLERLGRVLRTHGAVMRPEDGAGEVPFDRKSRAALAEKAALGAAAAALIPGGASVFVDAGTTTLEAGRRLLARPDLTLYTNSLPLLQLEPAAGTRLVALGGEVRRVSLALVGAGALEWVRHLRPDVALLGTSGISVGDGPTTTELGEAALKGAMAEQAGRVVVLADASKWAAPAAVRYCGWSRVHDLLTSHAVSPAARSALARAGTRVQVIRRGRV